MTLVFDVTTIIIDYTKDIRVKDSASVVFGSPGKDSASVVYVSIDDDEDGRIGGTCDLELP